VAKVEEVEAFRASEEGHLLANMPTRVVFCMVTISLSLMLSPSVKSRGPSHFLTHFLDFHGRAISMEAFLESEKSERGILDINSSEVRGIKKPLVWEATCE
jgi:hypothetical protein